ncbi:hypothetical protein HOLleu_35777 [Holothuria leucospilota]|uniref:Uncharacterized protein n=1 Tax=Holothuria leucospilota TaxID=206669 RepID=A0A9Q0YJ02_HOLLE|nr:hypothetical protein HOLleu_35777 [Holothuria leucospilota]
MKYPSTTYKKADATVVAQDFLAAAVEDIFKNEMFSLDTPLARAVKELAVHVQSLLGTTVFMSFAQKTVDALWKIVKKIQGSAWTDKLKGDMWHQFHLYRSAAETLERWQRTLSNAKIARKPEEEVFLLQHLLQKMFSALLGTLLETDMPAQILNVCPQGMDKSEEQALRYCAGYVPFKLRKRYMKMKGNDVAAQYVDILSSWSEGKSSHDADSLLDYTTKWIDVQNRGGLFKINDNVFILFKMMEETVRATVQVKNINRLQDENLQSLLLKKMEGDQRLLSRWNSVCNNLVSEGSSKLRTEVFKCFIKMRCESFIKVYLHIRKQNSENVSKKMEKSLRKELNKEKK